MAIKELRLCMGCMSQLSPDGGCSVCGYDPAQAQADKNYLAPGGCVGGRYLIGRLASSDPEGAWYVGYDQKQAKRVWVREYAPKKLMQRNVTTGEILPLPNMTAQYKSLLADFDDLCRSIARLPEGEKVIPIVDMVYAQYTIYAIYQYIKLISLESFLKRSGGNLSWRHTKKLLMPLYHTVANVHKAGLIHRGISPQTVMLDQTGALWLSCFSLAAARTNKSELAGQLFAGYAAPEQYQLNSWQGAWTDVYALGAVTYRALTGENPPSAVDRVYGDDLLERVEAGMTGLIVAAINKALSVEVEDRIQTAEALIAELLANEGSNTAVYTTPVRASRQPLLTESDATGELPVQRAADSQQAAAAKSKAEARKKKRKKGRRFHSALLLFLSALVATACLAGFVSWLSTNYLDDLLFPSLQQERPAGSVVQGVDFEQDVLLSENTVPQFVGANVDSIKGNAALMRKYTVVVQELFNSDYEKGVVFEQQPAQGTELSSAEQEITLFVSKGTELVDMPVVVGLALEEAEALLKELEIQYQIIEVFNNSYEPDVVVKCDREPESKLDKERDTVILYIKKIDLPSSSQDMPSSSSQAANSSSKSSSSKAQSSSGDDRLLKPKASSSEEGRLIKPKN